MRVRVAATGRATYSDVSTVCGAIEYDPEDAKRTHDHDPVLLVEVLSVTTEKGAPVARACNTASRPRRTCCTGLRHCITPAPHVLHGLATLRHTRAARVARACDTASHPR